MEAEALQDSLEQYRFQLSQVDEALNVTPKGEEYDSLSILKSDLQQLIDLTNESLVTLENKLCQSAETEHPSKLNIETASTSQHESENKNSNPLDDEYALFMSEMSKTGAYEKEDKVSNKDETEKEEHTTADINIEEELSSLEGMKCSTMYCHKWGGAPSLHNAMVCSVVRDEDDNTNFYNIMVRIMFTNPTHIEMIPCPYFLDGDCKFEDEQCRFSHGEVVALSSLSEAIEPNFSLLKPGCRVIAKLKQSDEPMSSKASEKYLLWHRAIVKTVDSEKHLCEIKLEHESGLKNNGKNYHAVDFSDIFPLTDEGDSDTDTESSSSETQVYSEEPQPGPSSMSSQLVQDSLLNKPGAVRLGDWEKHTKGIGSKLMMSMGYVAGTGLGPSGCGRVLPVPCQPSLPGRSLDHCMRIREHADSEDPLKVEKRLRRLQKKQEEREQKAYERAKEKEKHNVFNVLNHLYSNDGNSSNQNGFSNGDSVFPSKKMKADKLSDVKSSTCKNLNIEQFKIGEDMKKLEKDIAKLKSSLGRNIQGSNVFKSLTLQLALKSKEMEDLKSRQLNVSNEQSVRKDKRKLTVF